jgi:hypothetical protein
MKTTHLLSGIAIVVLTITAQAAAQTPNPSNGTNQTTRQPSQAVEYETINATPDPHVSNLMAPPPNGSIKIQNRGTVKISIALIDKDKMCNSPEQVFTKVSVSPTSPVEIEMCGNGFDRKDNGKEYIKMHDGHEFVLFPVVDERIYEIYWAGDKWGFHDVTEQRLHE